MQLHEINAYANYGENSSILLKILNRNKTLTLIKDYNCAMNSAKCVHNNPNLDLVSINENAKFNQDSFIHKRQQNFDINQEP